ncbi:hypothetical protein RND71_025022 [Anisodus tanguticus]|uniref:Uncharacterized protein n=1 Tax=Anisodus tanguticus TaxID=243964 RepID=A0AAE1VA08_9SOLA|nr:hypothetical protein RND71_025022 [Anisodus tanguticus]
MIMLVHCFAKIKGSKRGGNFVPTSVIIFNLCDCSMDLQTVIYIHPQQLLHS